METLKLTRRELYDLIWQQSILSLSKRFDISDVGLRKMCIRLKIPVPPKGYWTKVQFGKKAKKTPCPPIQKEELPVELVVRDENNPASDKNAPSPRKQKIKEVQTDPSLSLNVPPTLMKPDPLTSQAKSILSKQKPDTYNYIGVVSCGNEALNIRVAKSNVDRALRFFDTLIKILRTRGHKVEVRNGTTLAIVGDQDFELALREKMLKKIVQDGSWTRQEFHPKGILALQVKGWEGSEHMDGKTPLEEQLAKIVVALELAAQKRTAFRVAAKNAMLEREERERVAQELDARKRQDLANFKKLLLDSNRWHKAQNLRDYIRETEIRAKSDLSTETNEWLEWARQKADWYDPFLETSDELLGDVDRNTLEFSEKLSR